MSWFYFLSLLFNFLLLFREREREREKRRARNINWLPPTPLAMCPGENPIDVILECTGHAQSTEPHWPGFTALFFREINIFVLNKLHELLLLRSFQLHRYITFCSFIHLLMCIGCLSSELFFGYAFVGKLLLLILSWY